ncbi:MAG: ORF6N domain-containing protein [Candidatus Tantalella remota]|nr:ORF6N domain-containing protein [Candidatus Tantalella remota]
MVKKKSTEAAIVLQETIEGKILLVRGKKVMLDRDLAKLYGVLPKVLIQAVKRNIKRFPEDFMFQLSKQEAKSLRSQIVTLEKDDIKKPGKGKYSKYLPYAFTEQGVAMLSGVLKSDRAIQVNIAVIRVFVKLRKFMAAHKELALKLSQLEIKIEKHDKGIQTIFKAIKKLMEPPPEKRKRRIGFHQE